MRQLCPSGTYDTNPIFQGVLAPGPDFRGCFVPFGLAGRMRGVEGLSVWANIYNNWMVRAGVAQRERDNDAIYARAEGSIVQEPRHPADDDDMGSVTDEDITNHRQHTPPLDNEEAEIQDARSRSPGGRPSTSPQGHSQLDLHEERARLIQMGNDESERTIVGSETWYKFISGMIYKKGMVFVLKENPKFRGQKTGATESTVKDHETKLLDQDVIDKLGSVWQMKNNRTAFRKFIRNDLGIAFPQNANTVDRAWLSVKAVYEARFPGMFDTAMTRRIVREAVERERVTNEGGNWGLHGDLPADHPSLSDEAKRKIDIMRIRQNTQSAIARMSRELRREARETERNEAHSRERFSLFVDVADRTRRRVDRRQDTIRRGNNNTHNNARRRRRRREDVSDDPVATPEEESAEEEEEEEGNPSPTRQRSKTRREAPLPKRMPEYDAVDI